MSKKLCSFIKSILAIVLFLFFYVIFNSIAALVTKDVTIIQYLNNFSQLLLSLLLSLLFFKELKNEFKDVKKINFKKHIFIFIIIFILTNIITSLLEKQLGFLPQNEIAARNYVLKYPINGIISSVFLAPYYEEILIRLNFKKVFNNKKIFILTTGSFFALMHMLTNLESYAIYYLIPYALMGYTLSYIYYDSNTVFSSILFHALNNLIQIILILGGII